MTIANMHMCASDDCAIMLQ